MNIKNKPVLDPDFVPAALWNKEFKDKIAVEGGKDIIIMKKYLSLNVLLKCRN